MMNGRAMDSEGALRLGRILDRPRPKGWTVSGRANIFRHVHTKTSLIVTARREDDGELWVHASCARPDRLPDWETLKTIRDWLFGADALVVQVVPPAAEHVNTHPNCLHLWHCLTRRPVPDLRLLEDQI